MFFDSDCISPFKRLGKKSASLTEKNSEDFSHSTVCGVLPTLYGARKVTHTPSLWRGYAAPRTWDCALSSACIGRPRVWFGLIPGDLVARSPRLLPTWAWPVVSLAWTSEPLRIARKV